MVCKAMKSERIQIENHVLYIEEDSTMERRILFKGYMKIYKSY